MKHPSAPSTRLASEDIEGFTKQDGNTRFCSSNGLETEKRNSRCWRSRSFEWSPPGNSNVGRMGICFLLLSNVQRVVHGQTLFKSERSS